MATLTEEERDAKVEAKQQEAAEQKEQKEAEKSEHEDKYFVVHGGTCVCDKAEVPTTEAEIVVTKNTKLLINSDEKKFAATEEDTTMKPPTSTYGKCTLKPSSSGNLPCAPAFMPKWEKAYDKKTVDGKKILTELSTLQCTIGGKISIKKHGQEDSVVKEHVENTNEAEQALINPAVPLPVLKPQYPIVSNIDLKAITGRTDFKEVKSSKADVKKISIRVNEEATFNANLKNGNTRLTSWVIYQIDGSKVGKKIITSEQIGTTFKNTFPTLGTYRVEGYGQPKIGEKDKNWSDCSIDVEVIVNKLNGTALQPKGGDSFTRKNSKSENKLRKGFPATFEAKFLLEPNAEEIQNLTIYATDGSGNVITSGTQSGNTFSFTPPNSDGKYTINATYTNPEGKIETQTFTAATESAYVDGISHGEEVVRPETPMTFKVANTQFKTGNLSTDEANAVKWNLNGQLVGKGSTITIPGVHFLKEGKYVVEAYVKTANATGANAKNEEDDWHFEVKKNDVANIVSVGQPKVGKTTQLKVDKFLMPPIAGEKVVWNVFGKTLENSKNTYPVIDITPGSARKENVTCKINNQKGVTKSITIVEAEIVNAHFTDNNGIKIENASWDQKVNILIEQKHLIGEEINIEVFDYDYMSGNDPVYKKNIKKFDGKLVSFKLDKEIKEKTGTWGKLFFKVTAPHLTLKNADKNYPAKDLNVKDGITITNAIIGEENGLKQHAIVDYDKVSWFYANTTGIKAGTKLKVGVWEAVLGRDDFKLSLKPTIDEDGVLKAKIDWKNIPKIKEPRRVYIQVKDENDTVLFDSDGGVASKTDPSSKKSGFKGAATSLVFVAAAVYMVENMAAVVVGTQGIQGTSCGEKYCIKKGDKGELIREVNIRLAGFGGNVPTDEFTDRTEKMIKQFQRDYMKVTETGKICGNVLKSIDEFCNKWSEKILDYKCLCHASDSKVKIADRCSGYGKGKANEHPGMHRTLLWGTSALRFYMSQQKVYKIVRISAGYRCWAHNNSIPRTSTNHMGKAVDINFAKDGIVITGKNQTNIPKLQKIRDNFYSKNLAVVEGWSMPNKTNKFRLEPIGTGKDQSYSWIHMDVTKFDDYLLDKFFIKDQSQIIGKGLVTIATELGLNNLCSCGGFKPNSSIRADGKFKFKYSHSDFGNLIAKVESRDDYNICNKTKGGLKIVRNVNVTNTKIKDIVKMQEDRDIFAVGRYQLIPKTFEGAIKALGLDINLNLNEETQDRIFDDYLIKIKRPKIIKYLESNGTVEDAMYSSAQEWASIGVEKGKKISKNRIAEGDESYYAGDGLNKAHVTATQIKEALINSKK
ncbi:PAAR-like protein [uncultured Flavobacterium sp.]|uniref:PAAR-like protein n=1 Tax=uncultured Flavobacterium sp. TaxID=165435 RepID=UPI0030EB578B|tara:strand:+ start:3463 stop:7422 length:3960 start_codon:yes stop_codon:yes gene_type:complete